MSEFNIENANKEAAFNTYMYLANKINVADGTTFSTIVSTLRNNYIAHADDWSSSNIRELELLESIVSNNTSIANSRIGNQSKNMIDPATGLPYDTFGLNGCTFEDPNHNISVVFRGTAAGEWIDNGEGLSGVSESNIYRNFDSLGNQISMTTVDNDFSTDQQVQALNWFNQLVAMNGWDANSNITVSGHSKGGNKAQYVALNSDLVDNCYCFGCSYHCNAIIENCFTKSIFICYAISHIRCIYKQWCRIYDSIKKDNPKCKPSKIC